MKEEGRKRVVIEAVSPEIDAGRFPIKRAAGEQVVVEADAFTDGHDVITCLLRYRKLPSRAWAEVAMQPLGNDRWRAAFVVSDVGRYQYTVIAWVDRFKTWARDLVKRVDAGQDVAVDIQIGAAIVEEAAERTKGAASKQLLAHLEVLRAGGPAAVERALSPELAELMDRNANRELARSHSRELDVVVDPVLARCSAWYELFPRSSSAEPGRHGTFRDVEAQLPYVAKLGFDVLYLPPIHPIGQAFRKGKNNSVTAGPGDPGSPWAIGGAEGGHKAIHPELGTLDDFRRLVDCARRDYGIEIALDIAFQASPDHPYVREHPSWFRSRPDGTIQYAENPPKKYQDIYPFDFETHDWRALWQELKSVFVYWAEQGVRIFRVDNPHTKPFDFWEWTIGELKRDYPDMIFLSEAFTRPKVMYRLAKLGFTQSYNYFPWRNTRQELTEFMTELTQTELREHFRPNLWPNTPDILPFYLQTSGRPGFIARFVLAATLGASYGIYGPAYELCEDAPLGPGKEEYLNSEKYEIRQRDLDHPGSISGIIALVNRIRRENPALQTNERLAFHTVGTNGITNDYLIAYTKSTPDLQNVVLTVVNLDPLYRQSGWLRLPLGALGIDLGEPFVVHDLLNGARYGWNGEYNYVELDPRDLPASIFLVERPGWAASVI